MFPPATYNLDAPEYVTRIEKRLRIQEKQVYVAFDKSNKSSPKERGGQAAFTLQEKLNEAMHALDQETNQISSVTRQPIKALHFTE